MIPCSWHYIFWGFKHCLDVWCSVTVKVDDNVVRHFANESTFIIHIEQQQLQQQKSVDDNDSAKNSPVVYYDVTLSEIQL